MVALHSLRRFFVRPSSASTANHRGEVALRRGLAAALDKYEELPHDDVRVACRPRRPPPLSTAFPPCETESRAPDQAGSSARLGRVSAPPELPDVVRRAFDVSRRSGYVSFCRNETGRLLAALAATRSGTLAEFGTGCGVGTAWLRSGIREDGHILTAELDPKLADLASDIFAGDDQVEVLAADWSTLLDRGPFSLLFLDSREPKDGGPDTIADLVEPGGVVVLDDFTPCSSWPPVYEGRVDVLRERWLTDERFTTVEVMVAPDAAVLLATRH